MIRTVAELLRQILDRNLPVLDGSDIKHAPTIGDMYEGLSGELLKQGIPTNLGLQVVSGFATDGEKLSRQIDLMIVHGEGESIPFTDKFKWHVKDIVAVVEVKKTLHSSALNDALGQLSSVADLEHSWRQRSAKLSPDEPVNMTASLRTFGQMTGQVAPPYSELDRLPIHEQMVFHTLVSEQFSIVRVVLGLHGFKSEINFRQAMVKILEDNQGVLGFGPQSLPQLIICGNYALVKANGRPYSAPMVDGAWPFMSSTAENPLRILLELIWTRLDGLYGMGNPWGEDLETEVMKGLLAATGVERDGSRGWEFLYWDPTEEELNEIPPTESWTPAYLSQTEFTVLNRLCSGRRVATDDVDLLEWLAVEGVSLDVLQENLCATGLVAMSGAEFEIIAIDCQVAILPGGEFVAGENNTGRFIRWVLKISGGQRAPREVALTPRSARFARHS